MLALHGKRFATPYIVVIFATLAAANRSYAAEDADIARALFNEARHLAAEGQYERACPLFEKSLKLESGLGIQFNLADCWEHTGRSASAYEMYRKVASGAKDLGQSDRERVATQRADALSPKLSRIQVRIDSSVKALRISRAGVALEEHVWSEPTPVDPGVYKVASIAGDKELWSVDVTVPQQGFTVVVAVPPPGGKPVVITEKPAPKRLPRSTTLVAAGTRVPSASYSPTPAPVLETDAKRSNLWPTAGLLLGAGGLAFGTLFAISYQSRNDEAKGVCPSGVDCSDSDIQKHSSLVSDAKTARAGAILSLGVGVASLAAVSAYYIWKPRSREKPPNTAWNLAPTVGSGNGGFWGAAAQGSW